MSKFFSLGQFSSRVLFAFSFAPRLAASLKFLLVSLQPLIKQAAGRLPSGTEEQRMAVEHEC